MKRFFFVSAFIAGLIVIVSCKNSPKDSELLSLQYLKIKLPAGGPER